MIFAKNDEAIGRLEASQLRAAQGGDRQALGALYDCYAGRLYQNVLYPLLGNTAAAEDALSETFRAAFGKLSECQFGSEGVYPWLAKIARNKAMDMHRARATTGRALVNLQNMVGPLIGATDSPEDLLAGALNQQKMAQAVQQVLAGINERYCLAITLRFFEAQSRDNCAERLGVKLGTFDVLLLRALRAFRKAWPPRGYSREGNQNAGAE